MLVEAPVVLLRLSLSRSLNCLTDDAFVENNLFVGGDQYVETAWAAVPPSTNTDKINYNQDASVVKEGRHGQSVVYGETFVLYSTFSSTVCTRADRETVRQ